MANHTTFIKKHIYKILLSFLILVSIFAMSYFGNQKQGYHVDELYSYGLANSEYLPFMHFGISDYDVKDWMNEYGAGESFRDLFSNLIKDYKILKKCDFQFYDSEIYYAYRIAQANSADTYTTSWVPGQDYQDYLAVSKSNTFNFASVYYNQRGDVHPPFYYILLHSICSVFQGQFSKWLGLSLNIVLLSITLIVLYKMVSVHCNTNLLGLTVACGYAFSCGFMSTAMFIRMYALLTLMTLLCCYIHLEIQKNDFNISKKLAFSLYLIILGGYYTQYYFVIYAIGIASVTVLCMALKQKFQSLLKYIFIIVSSAITGILIWPFSLKHVFGGYRGIESVSILTSGEFYGFKAKYMINLLLDQMFGEHKLLIIIAMSVSILICLIFALIYKKIKIEYTKISLILIPILVYVLLVGQISPYLTDRYVMCSYPFLPIICLVPIYFALKLLFVNIIQKHCNIKLNVFNCIISILLICYIFLSNNFIANIPGYLFPGGQECFDVPQNTTVVYVIPDGSYNESAPESNIFAKCDYVGIVYESNLEVLAADYTYVPGQYLLVEMVNHMDPDQIVAEVKDAFKLHNLKELYRGEGSNCYRILLGSE